MTRTNNSGSKLTSLRKADPKGCLAACFFDVQFEFDTKVVALVHFFPCCDLGQATVPKPSFFGQSVNRD